MAPGYRSRRSKRDASKKLHELESQLMLLGWANQQFGFASNQELFNVMQRAGEGYDPDGRSHVARMLGSLDGCRVPPGDLARYDDNISRHLRSINAGRHEPITLKYFQQLAALYAELFFDRRATAPEALAQEIHNYVRQRVHSMHMGYPIRSIEASDLNKLAFWMATGSGKTLIMHLNYLQFLHYNSHVRLDNIVLITPNEGLSAQHREEFKASGIPSARFGEHDLFVSSLRTVRVTEITKLVERRKGKGMGVSIEVDAIGNRNLVFVDEGHRGASGEVWRSVRDAVAARGFTFEYSATFGQALAAANANRPKRRALIADYGKSIVFDYSYRYFHRDGFGKDFRVLNMSGDRPAPELADRLLFGNLLSFYEQLKTFSGSSANLRAYNLEQPLWVFVGGSVNAVYRRHGRDTSDVLTIQIFLHRVLSEPAWAQDTIKRLLEGKSGLYASWKVDLFAGRFDDLAKTGQTPKEMYADLLRIIFHADGPGGLRLCDIRGAAGELGLKAVGSDHYFGLTYIGDTTRFKKFVQRTDVGITLEEDAVGGSMFGRVNETGATINVLIGAKKFVEGWNSWRVSTMGLMNVGRAEGSEIIQLFGRGVRLKGKGMSLKRSTYLDGAHPRNIGLLETLNIFAVRADYMRKFREYLETEGLETTDAIPLRVPVRANEGFLDRGLMVPAIPDESTFEEEANFRLDPCAMFPVRIDRATQASYWESGGGQQRTTEGSAGRERLAKDLPLELVDWEEAYFDLMEHRRVRGMRALAVPRADALRSVLENAPITISANAHIFDPRSWHDREDIQSIVQAALRRCADKVWQDERKRWESESMSYRRVDESDLNLLLNVDRSAARDPDAAQQSHYIVSTPLENANLFDEITALIGQQEKLYEADGVALARIHFDRHLYQPLLIAQANPDVTVSPPPLNESETKFVQQLRDFWQERGKDLYPDAELFLLRNQGRGRGVGFFLEQASFYPDFILWMTSGSRQRVIFIEPHGMIHAKAYKKDEKARLHERLRDLSEPVARRSGVTGRISLDSYIVSATPYHELHPHYDDGTWTQEKFATRHILFPDERGDYIEILLRTANP